MGGFVERAAMSEGLGCEGANFGKAYGVYQRSSQIAATSLNGAAGQTAASEAELLSEIDEHASALVDVLDALIQTPAPCLHALEQKVAAIDKDGDWNQYGPMIAQDVVRLSRASRVCNVERCPAANAQCQS